jgi:lipopolysaccharide biosynthesis glycosyltransferase
MAVYGENTASSSSAGQTRNGVPKSGGSPHEKDSASIAEPVYVLLCTNALFLQHAAVCLTSLLANNPDLFFNVVIIGRATEKLDEEKFRRSIAQFSNHSLQFRQFTPPADQVLPLIPQSHYTIDTYTRLWAGDFFPEEVDRILYLDADIVVVGGIGPLWHTDLQGSLLGTVDIPGAEQGVKLLGMRAEDGYFNAGVLLIDLKQWRETHAGDAVLNYINTNPERVMYDQDALNFCFHHRRKRLDYKWNVIWPFFREPSPLPLARAELEAVRRDALIIHFNGASKPWSYFADHPRTAEYQKYLRMTAWRDFLPLDRTPLNMLRKRISDVLPISAKSFLKRIAK